jgi:murein DD-endopeptidase MepM/ murein hydrolase activator NlpD
VSFRQRLTAITAVCLVACGLAVASSPVATAEPATVASVQADIDRYMAEQAELDRQLNETNQTLTLAQGQLAQVQAQIAERSAEIAQLENEVAQIALQQWQSQGIDRSLAVVTGGDLGQAIDELTVNQWVAENSTALLDRYRQEKALLTALESAEATQVAQIAADQERISQLAAAADSKVQASQQLLGRLVAQATKTLTSTEVSSLNPAELKASAGLIKPLTAPVTSPFGYRSNPISGSGELHDGTDYGAACGTPVVAPANGTVTYVGYYGGFGNRVVIDHGVINGHSYVTSDNHLSSFAVSVGDTVTQGQTVAAVGTTGFSTGCHLHYIAWVDGALVDSDQLA